MFKYFEKKQLDTEHNLLKIGLLIMLNPIQFQNYWLGQTTMLTTLFLWLTFETFSDSKNALACGIYFALAVALKPIVLSVLPILLPIQWKEKKLLIDWNKAIKFFVGLAIFVLFHIIFFLFNPAQITPFLQVNLGTAGGIADLTLSESITYIVSLALTHISTTYIFLALFAISTVWIMYERYINHTSFIFCYMMALFNGIAFFMTSWLIYQLIMMPMILLFLIECRPQINFPPKEVYLIFALILLQQFIDLLGLLLKWKIVAFFYIAFYIFAIVKIKQGKNVPEPLDSEIY